jgi:hypothetical protein
MCSSYSKPPGGRIITKKFPGGGGGSGSSSSNTNSSSVIVLEVTRVEQYGICTVQDAGDMGARIDVRSKK